MSVEGVNDWEWVNIQMIYSKSLKELFVHKYNLDINVL